MAVLTYRNLTLQIVETKNVLREEILSDDQTTFLYLKWSIDVHCVYNPAATSFVQPAGQVAGNPTAQAGARPPETDAAIRNTLMQPRGQLVYSDEDGRLILRSPDVNYTVDCKNGPIPQLCEVIRIHGTKTWMVHFRIITYVNECPANVARVTNSNGQGRNILLSHRWNKYVDVDQDYFSVVTTQGTATFRVDELVKQGAFPDQMRQQLFPAIPPNFRREHIQVRPSEDGSEVDYIVTDREMAFNGPNVQNGTRIECFQTGSMSTPNAAAAAQASFMNSAPALINATAEGILGINFNPLNNVEVAAATAARLASIGLSAAASLALALLPHYSMHVFCRVWGNRNSSRQDLMNTAFSVISARLGRSGLNFFGVATDLVITQEITGKYVEVQSTVSWGPEKLALAAVGAVVNPIAKFGQKIGLIDVPGSFTTNPTGIKGLLSFFPASENIIADPPPNGNGAPVISQIAPINQPPPNSNGSRGTWVGQLMAQALSSPCSLPPQPPTVAIDATVDLNIYSAPNVQGTV